jgi:uncharacterized lipoprotein YddW (UPF0748 family)
MRTLAVCMPLAVLLLFLAGCGTRESVLNRDTTIQGPGADREFRAVWVATVGNIDWPSRWDLPTDQQQMEARRILDSAVSIGMNAIVFQVRPHCDAMYQSQLEPWSMYLTGEEGRAPEPLYDPLAFWIEEAHNRGLELHAWFNPYRAHLARRGEITNSCIVKRRPDLVRLVADSTYWLDPGDPRVQDYSLSVVMDVVRRYDIDGVHFDDYFYPYGDGEFPDDSLWHAYTAAGGALARDDWRRGNVNSFIERVYDAIKQEKRYVKFGISPFGIWRPGHPASISGFDQYARLFADARLWLNEGWIDYWSPQLYWPINQTPQSFPVLLGWWNRENLHRRHLWPGLYASRLNSQSGLDELINEIMVERGTVPENPGHILFSMKPFLQDTSLLPSGLKRVPYARPALVPATPWLGSNPPVAPRITISTDSSQLNISWTHDRTEQVFRWVLYVRNDRSWNYLLFNRNDRMTILPRTNVRRIELSAVDRLGNESTHAVWTSTP